MRTLTKGFNLQRIWSALLGLGVFGLLLSTPAVGGEALDQFVVFGTDRISVKKEVHIASGDIGSNGEAVIGEKARIDGQIYTDSLQIEEETVVMGDVHYNTLIVDDEGDEVVFQGTLNTPLPLPVISALPSARSPPASRRNVIKGEQSRVILSPGTYGKITIGRRSFVSFKGGTYNIRELHIGEEANVVFTRPTEIVVGDYLALGEEGRYQGAAGVSAQDVVITYLGNEMVMIGEENTVSFNMVAPNTGIALGRKSTFTGALVARSVFVGRESVLTVASAFTIPNVPNPDVIDLLESEALAAISTAGLNAQVDESLSRTVPTGFVINQVPDPEVSVEVPAGSTITVLVAAPVPAGDVLLPAAWQGQWQITVIRSSPTGAIKGRKIITDTICPDNPVGITLVDPPATCTGSSATDTNLTVNCSAQVVVPVTGGTCIVNGTVAVNVTRTNGSLTGTADLDVTSSGLCPPGENESEDITISGTRVSTDITACGTRPEGAILPLFARHPSLYFLP